MDKKDLERELDEIANPPERELAEPRAADRKERRSQYNFFIGMVMLALMTWIFAGMPGIY